MVRRRNQARNWLVCVHRIHTGSVYHEHKSLLTSTDHICACGSRLKHELQRHLCVHEYSLSSGQPCHLLAGLCLTFSLPVHHNTKHDLLQDDTVYRAPLPEPIRSTSSANEPLSHVNYESGGNPRNTSPTGYEPKELVTISGSSLEDIYQLYDVHGELGEQDQQASIFEEVRQFGHIGTQSLLDHEMADMSPVEKMSYLQSQMHFDESMESTADSDLEDGELQKLRTSPLYAQRVSGKPDAMVVQERGKCTNVTFIRRS